MRVEFIGNYQIEEHDEPFFNSRPEARWSVSEKDKSSNYYGIVYEAMLTEAEARRAVAALQLADELEIEPDDLGLFLERQPIFEDQQQ